MSVETIRDIPVIVEHRRGCGGDYEPMDFDDKYDSGFPFDNSGRRTRDPLEDIAQRHPEFAQHLQGFPRRSQRTGGDQDEDEFLRRRYERPFSSGRFERFGFPFDRDDFEREPQRYYEAYPEYFENFHNQQPQSPPQNQSQQPQYQQSSSQTTPQGYQQYPPQYSQQYQPHSPQNQTQQQPPQYQTQASQSVSQGTQTEECEVGEQQPQQERGDGEQEQKVESGQARGRPIQQSNTCDLSQHQPPSEALDERGQRSMSAPPENKRFTSSVNIPMGGVQQQESNAKSQTGSGSTERVIPIHVEGRDIPVMPKNISHSSSQQPQSERIFTENARSQPETIFGRRPDTFTQYVHPNPHRFSNDWPPSFHGFPGEDFGHRQTESPNRSAPPPQQAHQPPKVPPQQTQKPQEQQQQEPPKPQPPKQPQGPIEQIQAIQKDVSTLLRQVEAFNGLPRDKNYLYLDEMLTRNLLKLDDVDTQGQDTIRSARKEAIKCIERAIGLLEAKAAANVPKEEKMDVEQQSSEKMEEESASQETGASQEVSVSQETDAGQEPSAMEMSPAASQPTTDNAEVTLEAENNSNKNPEEQQPKSAETNMENAEEQVQKEEVKSEEAPKQEEIPADTKTEGDKKEKKKTKKKANKEDKEKKQ